MMKIVFWVSLLGIVYTYIGYPALVWVVATVWPRRWNRGPITPSLSIVLAVHNGVSLLERQIKHLLAVDYPAVNEVIIVSDGSTDGTAEMLKSQHSPRLVTRVLESHCGKAAAINAGVAEATGDILLFVDIRPEIAKGAIQCLVGNFADRSVGCASGNLRLRVADHDPTSRAVGGLYWRYEQWIRTCESLVHSPVGVYGGFYAIRRDLFTPQPVGIILDDMFQPLSIIRRGYRSVVDLNAVVYDTWPKKMGTEFNRKVRTLAGNYQLFKLQPWLLTPANPVLVQLFSHKVMRLIVPYLFLLLMFSSVFLSHNSLWFAALAIVQFTAWSLAFLALRYSIPVLNRLVAPLTAVAVLNAAAVVALFKFLFTRGPLWKIWTTGSSVGVVSGPVP